jgi:hypothetical protein
MRSGLFVLSVAGLLVAGCAEPQKTAEEPLYVPSTALVSVPKRAIDAYQVLPAYMSPEDYAYRDEKFVYGGLSVENFSAFTTWTYDNQNFSTLGSYGTRYRTVVQGGWAIPPAP